jgi:hypothetical protein
LCATSIVRFIVFRICWEYHEVQWIDNPMNSTDIQDKCLIHIRKRRAIWMTIFVIVVVTLYILDIVSMPKHLIMYHKYGWIQSIYEPQYIKHISNLASNKYVGYLWLLLRTTYQSFSSTRECYFVGRHAH